MPRTNDTVEAALIAWWTARGGATILISSQ